MDDHSHDATPMIVAVIVTFVALYCLIGFIGFKMGDLNDRIKSLEVAVQELVAEPG